MQSSITALSRDVCHSGPVDHVSQLPIEQLPRPSFIDASRFLFPPII